MNLGAHSCPPLSVPPRCWPAVFPLLSPLPDALYLQVGTYRPAPTPRTGEFR